MFFFSQKKQINHTELRKNKTKLLFGLLLNCIRKYCPLLIVIYIKCERCILKLILITVLKILFIHLLIYFCLDICSYIYE